MFAPGEKRASAAGLTRLGAGSGPVGTGFTVNVAVRCTALYVAVIVMGVLAVTVLLVIVKFALVAPAAIVTLAGTVAALVWLLDRVTTAPPLGAALVSVTVPCEVFPPVTVVGFKDSVDKLAGGGGGGTGVTVSAAVRVVPLKVAEMVTLLFAVTETVVIVKLALVAPAGTVTLAGVDATAEALLDRVTTAPPVGAALLSVTVPCEEFAPTTVAGLSKSEESVGAAGAAWGVKRREADQLPATPAEFLARTLHQWRTDARPVTVVWEAVEVRLRTSGVVKALLSSTWMS